VLLLENVRGLLSNDKGRTFKTITELLEALGYTVSYDILSPHFFGVPQHRPRVFIVAQVGAATGRLVAQSIYDAVTDIAPHALEGPGPVLAIEGPVESQMFQSPAVGALRRSNRSTRGVPHQRSDFEYE
jgi:site-specific DNA-cytosine methylase